MNGHPGHVGDIDKTISMSVNEDIHIATRQAVNEDTNEDANEDINEDIEDKNDELSPPPDSPPLDSPLADTISHASSLPHNALQDEIVVGSNAHHKSSGHSDPEPEDAVMGDPEIPALVQYQSSLMKLDKRKRASTAYPGSPVDSERVSPAPTEDLDSRRPARPSKLHGVGGVKGVLLGYWRDSLAKNEADKHGVVGFIDVRDRLRTRIQPATRDGRPMDQRYPIPPGPGGSWVTFDKVAFDAHLAGHNHHVIKEYVKIRADGSRSDEPPEERAKLDKQAIELAAERLRNNPPPEAATAPSIAYGSEIPANAVLPNRPETKKRRLAGSFGATPDSPKASQNPLDNIPGTRPTKILLGYWKRSSEEDPINKHAVLGILGANDMFRVKLARETRDGRTVVGNFPSGPGALWIHWDEVEFEPHLANLSRNEVKEYCRVRQHQLDLGEAPEERAANETKAVYEGQQRVAQSLATGIPIRSSSEFPPLAMKGSADPRTDAQSFASPGPPEELRQSRRSENGQRAAAAAAAAGRRPLPDIEFRAANRTPPGPSAAAIDRTNSLARREIARLEAVQARADMYAASREASLGPTAAAAAAAANDGTVNGQHHFQDNVSRLNRIWEAQEANRIRAGAEDAKMYMGVKYQRRQNGPFQGKLVSQGMIITIDGEDYVEYRVLTKPSFF
ncbi:hypothetical protein N658DRAFT_79202 [Parathielavia hyrcaniae]|uniref:Uncharacterized protein n=1 Tax=Parathielavia hyrcaniae TaxID=113614 RepID=A0AAN6Q3I9_9PEZI|nr:hypothetical protein N658DRAFT_79202 [Parathielavia hyrcaniae]